jgi:hypothetical protein
LLVEQFFLGNQLLVCSHLDRRISKCGYLSKTAQQEQRPGTLYAMVKVGACAVGDEDITVSINTDDVSVLWGVDSFFSCLGIFRGDPHYIQQHLDNRHFTKAVASLLHLQSIVVGASSSGEGVLACFSWAAATR